MLTTFNRLAAGLFPLIMSNPGPGLHPSLWSDRFVAAVTANE
jgi:hypothetical protein